MRDERLYIMRVIVILLVLFSSCLGLQAQLDSPSSPFSEDPRGHKELRVVRDVVRVLFKKKTLSATQDLSELTPAEDTRAVAICLTLTLGVFGAHRIYLGTEDYIPVFYTLTLGGGLGILPIIDLLHLCFVKDISPYYQNEQLIMWGGN